MPVPFARSASQTRPTFSRDFAGLKTLDHGAGPSITFTRASNATFFDAGGTLRTAAVNEPRFDHDPATGASRGLLIEESRTNLLERSAEFDNAYWTKGRATITANDIVSPDGGTNADKLTCNLTSGNGSNVSALVTIPSGATITVSAFFKRGSDDHAVINVADNTTNAARQWFNLATGTLASSNTAGSGWTKASASITSVGNGWYRCVFVVNTTGTTARPVFVPAVAGDLDFSCTSDVTFGYIWGAQLEAGAFPTSYIPTTTAAATRSADSAVVTPISSFYNQSEGTLFAEASPRSLTQRPNIPRIIASLNSNGSANQINIEQNGANDSLAFVVYLDVGGGPSAMTGGSSITSTTQKAAGAYAINNFAASFNGGAVVTRSSGVVAQNISRLHIGMRPSSGEGELSGHIRKIAYYPRRLSNTLLQQLTT